MHHDATLILFVVSSHQTQLKRLETESNEHETPN